MDYVLVGPFRVFLLFVGILFLHLIITRQPLRNYGLDYILKRITFYGSLLLLMVFVMVQLNLYDIFSFLSIILIVIIAQYFRVITLDFTNSGFKQKRISFLLRFFRFIEHNSIRDIFPKMATFLLPQRINLKLVAAFMVASACFVSRYLFLKNDLYTLSGLWQTNLEYIKQLNYNQWFSSSFMLLGEDAAINLYAKITGISEEMAVHSFGLLEVFGISIILYWIVSKVSKSKYLAPLFAVLFFGFVFRYLPININLLLEHNAIYMALWIALPVMLYTVLPNLLFFSLRKYTWQLMVAYCALFFVNLFVALFIVPIFLVAALVLQTKNLRIYTIRSTLAYLASAITVLGIQAVACWVNDFSFYTFLKKNLILVDVYTYFPQIEIGLDRLILYYVFLGLAALLALLPLYVKSRAKWTPALIILVFFNVTVSLKWLNWEVIDIDLYYQTIATLIALPIGIAFGIVIQYLKIILPKKVNVRSALYASLFALLFYVAYSSNGFLTYEAHKKDELKTGILLSYNTLSSNYLPYSYAVVNDGYGQTLSKSQHHFIHYNNFLENYLERDSIYQSIRGDEQLLKENSRFILSNSVFVFVSQEHKNTSTLATPPLVKQGIMKTLEVLKSRGRTVKIFYSDDYLTVYEVVNKKNSSKLQELILNL